MRRQNESPAELLLKLPWWVSVVCGLLAYAAMRWALPAWAGNDKVRLVFATALAPHANLALLIFGGLALGSLILSLFQRRLVNRQTSVATLRDVPWKHFEFLVAEAFRRQGYTVDFGLGTGADGGVDLVLRREGQTSLVQCKQWRTRSVGASVVREMFGLMMAEDADEAIIVTSGHFTRDAQSFAADKPIRLLDGPTLLDLIRTVQPGSKLPIIAHNIQVPRSSPAPVCPQCGKPMILRTARRGTNAGSQFWGCSTYPACKATRTA